MFNPLQRLQRLTLVALIAVLLTACGDDPAPDPAGDNDNGPASNSANAITPAQTPRAAALRFVEATAEGDIEKFMSIVPPFIRSAQEEQLSQNTRKMLEDTRAQREHIKSFEVLSEKIDDDDDVIRIKIVMDDGTEDVIDAPFIELDGGWYADSIFGSLETVDTSN